MWFKQLKLFETNLQQNYDLLEEQLSKIPFNECKFNTPFTAGWIPPIDEENDILVHEYKNYQMICLQIEEKILPAYVVKQELISKIKKIEADQQHTLSNKEKLFLKNQIYNDLLLQAFTKISKIYGYFDFANNRLIINSINAKHIELFISLLQKTIDEIEITPLTVKNLTTIMTGWLQHENQPKLLTIENVCVLKDPRKTNNIIRSQGYDLFSKGIKFFLQEGYQVEQIVMTWQDQVTFMLKDKFNFASLQYADELINTTKEYQTDTAIERFEVDFIIMTEILTKLFNDLLKIFKKE